MKMEIEQNYKLAAFCSIEEISYPALYALFIKKNLLDNHVGFLNYRAYKLRLYPESILRKESEGMGKTYKKSQLDAIELHDNVLKQFTENKKRMQEREIVLALSVYG